MTMIETAVAPAADGAMCVDRDHVAQPDNTCTTCRTLHLPTYEARPMCECPAPILSGVGGVAWRCGGCGLPNADAIRHPLV